MNKKVAAEIGKSGINAVHARSLDAKGKIVPRCGKYRGNSLQGDLVVTSDAKRVRCDKCKAGLS